MALYLNFQNKIYENVKLFPTKQGFNATLTEAPKPSSLFGLAGKGYWILDNGGRSLSSLSTNWKRKWGSPILLVICLLKDALWLTIVFVEQDSVCM